MAFQKEQSVHDNDVWSVVVGVGAVMTRHRGETTRLQNSSFVTSMWVGDMNTCTTDS